MSENVKLSESGIENSSAPQGDALAMPTIVEQLWTIEASLRRSAGLAVNPAAAPTTDELPNWCSKILEQLMKTILRPILKLRPKKTVNWRNYGKMIGISERYKTFVTHDMDRIFKEEGVDKLTDEQWQKVEALFGFDKLRERLTVILARPVADDEPLENLVDEALDRQFKHLDNLKSEALRHVALQDAKTTSLFFKGMADGYKCFLDLDGGYVGDRGRTRLYFEFLAYRMEIEKYRQTMIGKSRRDLQNWLIHEAKIPIPRDDEWFDHFCDEIGLRVKGVGRKRNAPLL